MSDFEEKLKPLFDKIAADKPEESFVELSTPEITVALLGLFKDIQDLKSAGVASKGKVSNKATPAVGDGETVQGA